METAILSGQVLQITSGHSSTSIFQFEWEKHRYILRKHASDETDATFDRKLTLIQLASHHNLGPTLHCYDADRKYMAIDFIDGSNPKLHELTDPSQVKALISKVRRMHLITNKTGKSLPYTSYFERIKSHLKRAGDVVPEGIYTRIIDLLSRIETAVSDDSSSVGLTHQDLHIGNMIRASGSSEITFIDWDDGGFGPTLCDFAQFTTLYINDDAEALLALNDYLQTDADSKTQQHFILYRHLKYMLHAAFGYEHIAQLSDQAEEKEEEEAHHTNHFEVVQAVLSGTLKLNSKRNFQAFTQACLHSALEVEACLNAEGTPRHLPSPASI